MVSSITYMGMEIGGLQRSHWSLLSSLHHLSINNIMAKVLVIADIKQGVLKGSTAELLSKAKAIGAETAVVAIGSNIESLIPGLVNAGSDTQYVADDPATGAVFSRSIRILCRRRSQTIWCQSDLGSVFPKAAKPSPRELQLNWMPPAPLILPT